jgi:AcrR family transcriptional regulator
MAKRAAGELEKGARRAEILARADLLFREKSYDEIRMADLSAELGLAKGTLYLYFPAKESLFFALLEEHLGAVFGALAEWLAGGTEEVTVGSMAAEAASAMAADPVLPRLLAAMHPVLEQKLPFSEALAFKRRLAGTLAEAGAGIASALPPLSPKDGRNFLMYFYAQVVGLVSLTDLSPFMKKVGAEPGLEMFKLDFEATLRESTRALLAGLVEAARSRGEGGDT